MSHSEQAPRPSRLIQRPYLAPLVATSVLLVIFGAWNVLRLQELQEDQRTHLLHISQRLAIFLDITLHQHDDMLQRPERITQGLRELQSQGQLETSLAVVVHGQPLAAVGAPIPEIRHGRPGVWERPSKELVIAQPIRSSREQPLATPSPFSEDPLPALLARPFTPETPLVFMVLDPTQLPTWHPRLRAVITEAALGLVLLLSLLAVWIMGIRQRRTGARLELEQSRIDHLKELNIAAAGLAHETKNPLGLIRGLSQRLHASSLEDREATRGQLEQIIEAADRATERLGEFLHFARMRDPVLAPVDPEALLGNLREILHLDFEDAQVKLEIQALPGGLICDEAMLSQLLLNLLLNSLRASSPGSAVQVRLEEARHNEATLTVRDQGCGIPEVLLPRVFEPYITGSEQGNGLGLAIVKRIAQAHSWGIELESQPGEGTTLRITHLQRGPRP